MSGLEEIASAFGDSTERWKAHPAFYCAEPWDVSERSDALLEQAVQDNADLFSPDLTRAIGPVPHGFQTDYLLSKAYGRVILSAGQIGKSWSVLMDILIRATGEIPISMRYPAGHQTDVPRPITRNNIVRWGRRSKDDGEIIDHNFKAVDDDSWDCGNIMGVGVYPISKIVPAGSMIRLASYQGLIKQVWWPAFTGEGESETDLDVFVPEFFKDKTVGGNKGYHAQEMWQALSRGVRLQFITYEAKKKSFEGRDTANYLDEEPPDEALLSAMHTHSTDWSLSETPWRGITYSKKLAFPETLSPQRKTFHATLYDCPYKTEQDIQKKRGELEDKPWEISARVWGIPADVAGKPYYDRMKINLWMQKYPMPYRLVRFVPTAPWHLVKTNEHLSRRPGLLDVPVEMKDADEEDLQNVWRVYEDREDGVAFGIASDQADGAEVVQDAGDGSTAVVGKQKGAEDDATRPVVCATLFSTLPTADFAREVMYGARYFNNALLCPEAAKGAANATFTEVCKEWPWWLLDTVTSWSSRKPKENRGFCATHDRREIVFDKLLRDWFNSFTEEEYPEIPDERILREAAGAIVGQTKGKTASRCDHPSDGTIDSLMAYGILMWAMQKPFLSQWRCHGKPAKEQKESWFDKLERQKRERQLAALQGKTALGSTVTDFHR